MELGKSKYTLGELQKILGYFVIEEDALQLQPLTAGYINDTFLVSKSGNPLYVLQRINDKVFKDIQGLMSNAVMAIDSLSSKDYASIKLLRTRGGEYFTDGPEGYWRLMSFIHGSITFNNTTQEEVAFEAGRIIGKFHCLLQNEDMSNYVDTIPCFHNLCLRENEFEGALRTSENKKLETAKNAIHFARKTLVQLKEIDFAQIPLRICHNDTKLNNILFSKISGKALCLIDLDTLMKGYFFYDFGDAVRTIANTAPEDERDNNKITFNKSLFSAFIKGLADNGLFLLKEELDSLCFGAVFMPFIHGLRALTDYLNNDRYYKTTYENQNLDRCSSLFNFTQKALDNVPFMEKTIQEYFPSNG